MPVRLATLYRGLIVLAIVMHVMYMYGMARVMGESVGLDAKPTLIAAGFAMAMVIPLFFAAGLPELPDVISHRRREQRWARGECPECGYDLTGVARAGGETCPECGTALADPGGYQLSWRTLQRFAIMAAIGWLIGCAACEGLLLFDEWRFAQELAVRGVDTQWSRPRVWPFGSGSLVYVPGEPIYATD